MNIKASVLEADETFTDLITVLLAIKPDQYNTVPFTDSWTAGQLAQHLILSAGGFNELLNGAETDTYRDAEEHIPNLKAILLNFDIKLQSPDFIIPELKIYDKHQQADILTGIKTNFLTAIKTLDITKTCTNFEIPNLGYVTRAEAIIFTIIHTQRHIHQLKNIAQHLDN